MSERRVALVTGATRGIGRTCAVQLADQGYDVAFCYKNSDEQANTLCEELSSLNARTFCKGVEVSNYDAVQPFVQEILKPLRRIDVLVNNAGIVLDQPLVLMQREVWEQVLRTNLDSVYNVTRGVAFAMLKRNAGSIINI